MPCKLLPAPTCTCLAARRARPSLRRICNQKIISRVQQIICFAFHDSRLLLETCHHAKDLRKIVTLFYLD